MKIDSVSGMPSEVERPVTTGAVTAAATEVKVHSNETEPVLAVADVQKPAQATPNGRGETIWLEREKRQVFRVVDRKTGETICQVPTDEVLRVSRNLEDLLEEKQQNLDIKS